MFQANPGRRLLTNRTLRDRRSQARRRLVLEGLGLLVQHGKVVGWALNEAWAVGCSRESPQRPLMAY